jgi:cold shock CspA family protein
VKPTPAASPTPAPSTKPTQAVSPTPKASASATPKPLQITPPKSGADTTKSSVSVQNLVPGQKIKVTIVEGKSLPSTKPTKKADPKVKPSPLPSINNFKVTTKAPVKVAPKPSGSSAGIGIKNLKPGQKIKVTIKTGGTKK